MKKLLLTQLMLLLFASVCFMSCGDDDPETPQILLPKLDGFYVYGTNTIAAGPTEAASKMTLSVLDKGKPPAIESKAGVFGKFMYIGANSTINFAQVDGEVGSVWGAVDGGSEDLGVDIDNVPVNDIVVNGTLVKDGAPINVTNEGLYYVFVDSNTGVFVFMPVKPGLIGPATPNVWEGPAIGLPLKSANKDKTVFEGDVPLRGADGYRYKLHVDGWHAYDEAGVMTTLTSLGVPDYDVAWDTRVNDVGLYLPNMPNHDPGIFTITLTYTAATNDWEEKKVFKAALPENFSNHNIGIIGSAIAGTTWDGNETGGYELKKPVKAGDVYTWTWNDVTFLVDGEFIFLQDAKWGKFQLDFVQSGTVGGSVVTGGKIVDATTKGKPDHNYYVVTAGTYDVVLVVNGATGIKTVTITE